MPIIIANNWNALREGINTDSEGNSFFTGNIIVTFFLDKKIETYYTGTTNETEATRGTQGVIKKVVKKDKDGKVKKDKNGKNEVEYYKVTFEHQIVVPKATRVKAGFDGWSVNLISGDTLVLPKGRGEIREILVEDDDNKEKKEGDKPKTKLVRAQGDDLLEAIFTVKANA